MALSDKLEALAKRHGALSYRNRADTQNPAFGFSEAGLASLLAEVRKQDDALILQLVEALEHTHRCIPMGGFAQIHWGSSTFEQIVQAAEAGRAWLEGKK